MEFVTDLNIFSTESSFLWKINNISSIPWSKGFVIKSKKINIDELNIEWYLQLSPLVYKNGTVVAAKFYLKNSSDDLNVKYKSFNITLEGKSIFKRCMKNF